MTQKSINRQSTTQRAIADLRRGVPVIVSALNSSSVVLSAELATEPWLELLQEWTQSRTILAMTNSRASALNIKSTGHAVILLELTPWLDPASIRGLADATTDLSNPFRGPFKKKLRHPTEIEHAAIQLVKQARLLPAVLVAPLNNNDVTFALEADLLSVESEDIFNYEADVTLDLRRVVTAPVPLVEAENTIITAFRPADGGVEHLAIIIGDPTRHEPVLTRLHSECFTGDLLDSLKCDCGQQLRGAIKEMANAGGGVLIYLAQEGRGIGLINKLRAYRLQADGFDTIDANLRLGFDADERLFRPAAEILTQLGFKIVRLLTNNPEKVEGLEACGIKVSERVPHSFPSSSHNQYYLSTKKDRSGHLL